MWLFCDWKELSIYMKGHLFNLGNWRERRAKEEKTKKRRGMTFGHHGRTWIMEGDQGKNIPS